MLLDSITSPNMTYQLASCPVSTADLPGDHGVLKVYLRFADIIASSKARDHLNGRSFAKRRIEAQYMNERKFSMRDF